MAEFDGFQCPLCGLPLVVKSASLCCEKGHTYDVARKGYVNLHQKPAAGLYDKSLFDARRAVFEAGFYAPVVSEIKEILKSQAPSSLLDAGCGEGYYLSELSPAFPETVMAGVDLSREAIISAAGRNSTALYCVGDLNRLPFRDGVFDVVLNILSPANYAGFIRVMKRNGLFIKVMPGSSYLKEIRERLKGGKAAYDDTLVPEYLKQHMQVLSIKRISDIYPLTPQEFEHFAAMTPLTESLYGDERTELLHDPPGHITIDLQFAVCRAAV